MSEHEETSREDLTYPLMREVVQEQVASLILCGMVLLLIASVEMFIRTIMRGATRAWQDSPFLLMLGEYSTTATAWSTTFATEVAWWASALITVLVSLFQGVISRFHLPGEDPRKSRNRVVTTISLFAGATCIMWLVAAPASLSTSGTAASIVPGGILTAFALGLGLHASRFRAIDRVAIAHRALHTAEDNADRLNLLDPRHGAELGRSRGRWALAGTGFAVIVVAVASVALAFAIELDPWRTCLGYVAAFILLITSLSMLLAARFSRARDRILFRVMAWVVLVIVALALSVVVSSSLQPYSIVNRGWFFVSLGVPLLSILGIGVAVHLVGIRSLQRAPWLADWMFPWAVIALQQRFAEWLVSRAEKRADRELDLMSHRLRA